MARDSSPTKTSLADEGPDELVAEIEQVRERLAGTVDQLVHRTNPKTIAGNAVRDLKATFVTSEGQPRLETIGPVVGGVVALVGLVIVIRKIAR